MRCFGAMAKAADAEAETVYTMYYDYREPLKTVPTHRILAINRGEKEDALKVSVELDKEKAYLSRQLATINTEVSINTELSDLEYKFGKLSVLGEKDVLKAYLVREVANKQNILNKNYKMVKH